jgi:hypothetical protein
MEQINAKSAAKLKNDISDMLKLHVRAYHLPQVRLYQGARRSRKRSDKKANRKFGKPPMGWTLPLHLIDLKRFDSLKASSEFEIGWMQFINWRHGLFAIAEIRKDLAVSSVATGPPVKTQFGIVNRILGSRPARQDIDDIRVVAAPVLHFRALVYLRRKKDKKEKIVIPLFSAAAQFRLGKKYTASVVRERLETALAHRIRSGKESKRRSGRRKSRPLIEGPQRRLT